MDFLSLYAPIITYALIAITVLISALAFSNELYIRNGLHMPYWEQRSGEYYRLLSAGFLHGDWMHLGFNMYALYGFGGLVESWFQTEVPGGRFAYLAYYLIAVVLANIPTMLKHKGNPNFRSLGASGAVSAVVFSSILMQPDLKLMIMFIPIPISGWLFGLLYLLYSSYASKNNNDAIDHEAHFWGAVFGLAVPAVLQPELLTRFMSVVLQ